MGKKIILTKKEARLLQMDYISLLMVNRTVSGNYKMAEPLAWADEVRKGLLEKIDKTIGKFNPKEMKKLLKTKKPKE